MTPPINPTKKGKLKYAEDTIKTIKLMKKSERGSNRIELNKVELHLTNYCNLK